MGTDSFCRYVHADKASVGFHETSVQTLLTHARIHTQLQALYVADKDLRVCNVLHFNLFPLLRDCSTAAQPYTTFEGQIDQ